MRIQNNTILFLIILKQTMKSINMSNIQQQQYQLKPYQIINNYYYSYPDKSYSNDNSYSNDYDNDEKYSKYPTMENNYECRTGPLEGFFASSVEFCKHVKFDKDDRKDN